MELSVWWNQSQAANAKRACENRRRSCPQHGHVLYTRPLPRPFRWWWAHQPWPCTQKSLGAERSRTTCSQVGHSRNKVKGCSVSPGLTVRGSSSPKARGGRSCCFTAAAQPCTGRGPNTIYRDKVPRSHTHQTKWSFRGVRQRQDSTSPQPQTTPFSNLNSGGEGRVSPAVKHLRSWGNGRPSSSRCAAFLRTWVCSQHPH